MPTSLPPKLSNFFKRRLRNHEEEMLSKRVLITGGCGFVGANLIEYLNKNTDYSIRVLDNESMGKYDWINEFNIDFFKGDIREKNDIRSALQDIDVVVHLAADTRVIESIENPAANFETNVSSSFHILEEMRHKGIRRFVNASTGGAILGEVPPPVDEEMVPQPVSPYGASKLAVEGYCSAFSESYEVAAISLRFSNVYGVYSYHKGSVVAHFFKNILRNEPLTVYGDGTQTRDYIFSRDLCSAIHEAIVSKRTGV